jgi:hypothetical protein
MIAFLDPLALLALIAVTAPVVVHLLLRHRAPRIRVPTVRFVPGRAPQAIRLLRPSDPWLLLLRAGIVAFAALALAQPLFLTDARRTASNERMARAVVIDTSHAGRSDLAGFLEAERTGSDPYRQVETRDLPAALRRAANWLGQAPPARREVVIFSRFDHGALTEADLAAVPRDIGLRFVRFSGRSRPEPLQDRVVSRDGVRSLHTRFEGDATRVEYLPAVPWTGEGLVIRARPGDAAAVERLRRIVAMAGAPESGASRLVAVRLRGGDPHPAGVAADPDASAAALRLLHDPAIDGLPVTVSASAAELRIDADVEAASLEAAAIVRAALEARRDPGRFRAHEVVQVSDAVLRGWSRAPAQPSVQNWRQSDRSDARWFWLAALLLLTAEGHARRSRVHQPAEARADAA